MVSSEQWATWYLSSVLITMQYLRLGKRIHPLLVMSCSLAINLKISWPAAAYLPCLKQFTKRACHDMLQNWILWCSMYQQCCEYRISIYQSTRLNLSLQNVTYNNRQYYTLSSVVVAKSLDSRRLRLSSWVIRNPCDEWLRRTYITVKSCRWGGYKS